MFCRYELIHPPDGKWGVASNDNIWNGMLGQLQRRVSFKLIFDSLTVKPLLDYFHNANYMNRTIMNNKISSMEAKAAI